MTGVYVEHNGWNASVSDWSLVMFPGMNAIESESEPPQNLNNW